MVLNGLPWKGTKIILWFLRLHPSTAFRTLLLTMMATRSDRVPDELWTEVHDIVQETGIKIIPMEKKCKKSKMAVWGGLTNSCEKKRS